MSKYLAIIGYSRFDLLKKVFEKAAANSMAGNFHLRVFVDGPKTSDVEIEQKKIINYFSNNAQVDLFLSFSFVVHPENLGVWRNKLLAFESTFKEGSTFTLLLEDDVLLKPDALTLTSEIADNFHQNSVNATLSLYSQNLIDYPGVPLQRAKSYISNNFHETFSGIGARKWAFPWGLGLTKDIFEKFLQFGWNGHDQTMGQIMLQQGWMDVFPIISRASHVGVSDLKSSSNKVYLHVDFSDSDFKINSFDLNKKINLDHLQDTADYFYMNLSNDFNVDDVRIKIFTSIEDSSNLRSSLLRLYRYLDLDIRHIPNSQQLDGDFLRLNGLLERISTNYVFYYISDDKDLANYIVNFYAQKNIQCHDIGEIGNFFPMDVLI